MTRPIPSTKLLTLIRTTNIYHRYEFHTLTVRIKKIAKRLLNVRCLCRIIISIIRKTCRKVLQISRLPIF